MAKREALRFQPLVRAGSSVPWTVASAALVTVYTVGLILHLSGGGSPFVVVGYLLPEVLIAWRFGLIGGIAGSILGVVINTTVLLALGPPQFLASSLIQGLVFYTLAGGAVGLMSDLRARLSMAMDEIRTLRGILPMCSHCKKIRDEQGRWIEVAVYVRDNTHASVSHGLCPTCLREHYPEYAPPV